MVIVLAISIEWHVFHVDDMWTSTKGDGSVSWSDRGSKKPWFSCLHHKWMTSNRWEELKDLDAEAIIEPWSNFCVHHSRSHFTYILNYLQIVLKMKDSGNDKILATYLLFSIIIISYYHLIIYLLLAQIIASSSTFLFPIFRNDWRLSCLLQV